MSHNCAACSTAMKADISSCRTWMNSMLPARCNAPITPLMPSPDNQICAELPKRVAVRPRNHRLSSHASGSAGIDAFGSIRPCRLSSAQKSEGILALSEL